MREYLEILIYRFKKQNGLDVYSELSPPQLTLLSAKINQELVRLNRIAEIKNMGATNGKKILA